MRYAVTALLAVAGLAAAAFALERSQPAWYAKLRYPLSYEHVIVVHAENYDLVLNTERVSVKDCIDEVLRLVRSEEFAETEESRRRLGDLALACRVRAALRRSPRTRELRVSVSAADGRVALAGMLDKAEERAAVNEVAAEAGARDIDDQLRTADAVRPRFQ